jgi:putative tricarboxylic transport membrane protein
MSEPGAETGVSKRALEMGTAAALLVAGVLVVLDSLRVGQGWDSNGPKAGFYPFYVGLILSGCALWLLLRELLASSFAASSAAASSAAAVPPARFASKLELERVLSVLIPATAYVALIFPLGIYVASALFLVGFMRWQGKYGVLPALTIGLAVPLALFCVFELWFKLPLPKGPLENLIGY